MGGVETGSREQRLDRLRRGVRFRLTSLTAKARHEDRFERQRLRELLASVEYELAILRGEREPETAAQAAVRERAAGPKATVVDRRLYALGVTASDVRQWAREQGLTNSTRGRIGLDLVEAWAAAHPTTTERSSHQ